MNVDIDEGYGTDGSVDKCWHVNEQTAVPCLANTAENSSEFREAMRLFQLGRREDAMNALEKLVAEGRADYISEMYLEYIKDLSSDDKANVFRFVRK